MEDFSLIDFIVTDKYFGWPKPFIPDDSVVILIQDAKIGFALYKEATTESPYPTLNHPADQARNKALELEVETYVRQSHPEYLKLKQSIVLTCPKRISEQVIF